MKDDEGFVDRCRQEARALQRDLKSGDVHLARAAAVQFAQLPHFVSVSLEELIDGSALVSRADALAVVALAHGFVSWAAVLESCLPGLRSVMMHSDRMAPYLNRWFAGYEEAAASLRDEGGYLLPYRKQFFITVHDAIREIGLDPDDPDWERIGFDWVRPRDVEAHLRLCRLRLRVMVERGEELA